MTTNFGVDYFLHGEATGVSNYTDYRWLPDQTLLCCTCMMRHLGAIQGESVLDYGCARGYYVRALRLLGYDARGVDTSTWAIVNCDSAVKEFVGHEPRPADWVLCKDVAEHVPEANLPAFLQSVVGNARKGALIIVPLVDSQTRDYLNPADRRDVTHVIRYTLGEWHEAIQHAAGERFVVGVDRLPGVKEAAVPGSQGFITVR